MLHFYVWPKLVRYSCICRGLEARLCILPLILNPLWRGLLSDFSFLMACFFQRVGPCLIIGYPFFFKSILCFSRNPAAIFYHTTLLFLSWCYLTYAYWASLGLLLILLLMTQYGHWFYTHATLGFSWPISLLIGSFVPFISSWAFLTHLLFLGILGPFSNFAYSWAFTNSHWTSLAQLLYSSSLGLINFPSNSYFLTLLL